MRRRQAISTNPESRSRTRIPWRRYIDYEVAQSKDTKRLWGRIRAVFGTLEKNNEAVDGWLHRAPPNNQCWPHHPHITLIKYANVPARYPPYDGFRAIIWEEDSRHFYYY